MRSIRRSLEQMYGVVCKHVLLPAGDGVFGQRVMRYYARFSEAQWWGRERLMLLQDQAVRDVVRVAYEQTPFYHELYRAAKLNPEDIEGVADLQKLPVVTKDMLRSAYPLRCVRHTGRAWQECFTSGSSGRPFAVRVDTDSLSAARALMLLRARFSGWDFGEPFLQTGMSLERGFVRKVKDRVLRVSYVSAFNLSNSILDRYLDLIERQRLRYVMGYAASLYLLARRAEEVGFSRQLHGVVSWGDKMFNHYRRQIEKGFGCKVTDTYGCGEGIQVAAQCGSSDGAYHVFMPHVAVEFTRGGMSVEDGELGEILLTRLDAGAMPLIRYAVGDVGRAATETCCPCGRGFRLMQSIEGRTTDIVSTPNGNRLIVHFFTGLFEYARSIDTFQVIQERPDRITVRIVPRGAFDAVEWRELERQIHEKGDPDLGVDLEVVAEIPTHCGNKRRFVVSKLGAEVRVDEDLSEASHAGKRSLP
jgi:phenylacetate-CoA ligase